MKNIFTLIFLTLSLTIFSQDTTRILFLGNSYTYGNDLPNLLKQLALAEGKVIVIDQNTPGGHTLNGHSNNTTSLNKIREGNWD